MLLFRPGCPIRLQSSADFNLLSLERRITDYHKTTWTSLLHTGLGWRSLCMERIRFCRPNRRTANAGEKGSCCSEKPYSFSRSRTGRLASVASSETVSAIRRCPLRPTTTPRRTHLPRRCRRRTLGYVIVHVVSWALFVRLHAGTLRHASCKLATMPASGHSWMNVGPVLIADY